MFIMKFTYMYLARPSAFLCSFSSSLLVAESSALLSALLSAFLFLLLWYSLTLAFSLALYSAEQLLVSCLYHHSSVVFLRMYLSFSSSVPSLGKSSVVGWINSFLGLPRPLPNFSLENSGVTDEVSFESKDSTSKSLLEFASVTGVEGVKGAMPP